MFHRIAGQPVIVLGRGDAVEAKRRLVERAGGTVANVVDRPDLCDVTTPAIDRDPEALLPPRRSSSARAGAVRRPLDPGTPALPAGALVVVLRRA